MLGRKSETRETILIKKLRKTGTFALCFIRFFLFATKLTCSIPTSAICHNPMSSLCYARSPLKINTAVGVTDIRDQTLINAVQKQMKSQIKKKRKIERKKERQEAG